MSIAQTTPDRTPSGSLVCPGCHAPLPPHATFCSSCGERIDKKKHISSLLQDEFDITARYRITSLIRRRPHVNLYFALDNQQSSRPGQQRMVAMRDIDITALEDEARGSVIELVQQEYDLLRRLQLPHVTPVTDLRSFQGHVFVVTGQATTMDEPDGASQQAEEADGNTRRLYTLQDFLQSGQGLPSEQRTLEWMASLCQALDRLHRYQIVVGDLDPYTIILNQNSDEAQPMVMVSWLLPHIRDLLPPPTSPVTHLSYFSAPEALLGKAEPRSDIYSLGAIFYLLLTGTPPDESALRTRRRLRAPHELNSRISTHVDECVMQALSVDPSERFQSVGAMAEALHNPRFRRPLAGKPGRQDIEGEHSPGDEVADVDTVRIVPLSQKNLVRWQTSRPQAIPQRPLVPRPASPSEQATPVEAAWEQQRSTTSPPITPSSTEDATATAGTLASGSPVEAAPVLPGEAGVQDAVEPNVPAGRPANPALMSTPWTQGTVLPRDEAARPAPSHPTVGAQFIAPPAWKQRITGMLRAITPGQKIAERNTRVPTRYPEDAASQTPGEGTWLQHLQRLILGQQQHTTMAAAIIETPLRVQPNQGYTIRMHIMGRDEPVPPPVAKIGSQPAGLSALVHGDTLAIEVRSALHQSYAYIVQQAVVTIPAAGYVAELTIPMQPLASGPSGRRDRLHIFFLDGREVQHGQHGRHPLYEKPFVVELFVSHLVQPGREGHNVLTIPV